MIELNHYYLDGEHQFDQVIVYEWSAEYRRFDVRAYWLAEELVYYPRKCAEGYCTARRIEKTRYRVSSKLYRETWTQVDPEHEHKRLMDEECRSSLLRGTKSILER